ncbi:MAG: hypothetical protein VX892_02980 [Candidatus Thermoplasmatota archaeon]|nr:hypothetical protein [Candidatus Thermoplasmatota archaeon]MEC7602240.1 hypothetical protein [Candidatus Thermoplasmatota archaeon]MEC8384310.1 hypothetical protein [Candidatus Thermoplasmatota archaeon]MED5375454.1 hypothetical protein [Candidatus Thermoplasmatota archaeon]|tara:strand:+ start:8333 stop:9970 length:1638 start_codon:yes stop_codon:yes gene_type:complete
MSVKRNEPNFSSSFPITFKMMFKEEWRQNVDFAKSRRILMFPALLAVVSMALTIGLRFLTGDGVIGANAEEISRETFTFDELRTGIHLMVFLFSMGMGTFAFLGRSIISQRSGGKNFLLASPAMQPIDLQTTYLAYYLKEVSFYIVLILTPVTIGMALGIASQSIFQITTPLLWKSLLPFLICISLTLAQGIAISFFGSTLMSRGGQWNVLVPILGAVLGALIYLRFIPIENAIIGLWAHSDGSINALMFTPLAFFSCIILAWISAGLLPEDFEVRITGRDDLFVPVYEKLGKIGLKSESRMRILIAKEIVDVLRSGTLLKMLGSFAVPLLFLLLLAWGADFASFPIPFNLLSYAPFIGFFGFNFYSWLNAIDAPDHLNTMPISVPELLKAKIWTYFLLTSWIGVIFILLMAWMLDQWDDAISAMVVMLANSIYIVSLSAWLMGLRPNKAIFDSGIMARFWIATSLPLIGLFVLSFTKGDTTLLENWSTQVSTGGLNAEAQAIELEQMQSTSLTGILGICAILVSLSFLYLRLLKRKWGSSPFEN